MIQNKEFVLFEIKFHGEIICFLENPFKRNEYSLSWKPSFKWDYEQDLDNICEAFEVIYNCDDCFEILFYKQELLMKKIQIMFRLIRFLLEENKKQEEQKENVQNGFGNK